MNELKTRKVFGRITKISETLILVDPLYESKFECIVDETQSKKLPNPKEDVTLIVTDGEPPRLIELIESYRDETASTEGWKIKPNYKAKEIVAPVFYVRGRIQKRDLSDSHVVKVGMVTLQLQHMQLELMYGKRSTGVVPPEGSMATVEIYDTQFPIIKSIEGQTRVPEFVPNYVPRVPAGEFRWPIACMECGTSEIQNLYKRSDKWEHIIARKKLKEFSTTQFGTMFSITTTYREKGPSVAYVEMNVTKYLCKECRKKNKKFKGLLEIDIRVESKRKAALEFKFKNEDYDKSFRYFNKEPYLSDIKFL